MRFVRAHDLEHAAARDAVQRYVELRREVDAAYPDAAQPGRSDRMTRRYALACKALDEFAAELGVNLRG